MTNQASGTYHIFYHSDSKRAVFWANQISKLAKDKFPKLKADSQKPGVVIALGGDGTILEAARKYHEFGSVVLGLNLGNVGFLASVRGEKDFLPALKSFFSNKYNTIERMMIIAKVRRKNKVVFSGDALNEIVVKNPLGVMELEARVEDHPVQYIRGTGVMVATATGSTAYNLSAHGPIVMPDIKCLIITEILDHSIPTPSVVVKYNNKITVKVLGYKKRGILSLSKTGQKIDVILAADGESIFPLEIGDEIVIQNSPHLIKFAELEKHYFFKSLEEKFGFK
ncbi:MAG: hypothetical protein A3B91_02770 [Candidatus Yanofskybacteria bacterium RIFCSPHIGHO2_02_FULL_41_29]|uniref:NAD kinase n=1 Tax=Candidatus Yanofskybacteria bacterium RIFCSPHIGHO2_01_FULL_41_53 TaxID=1802663 RepID=A0A1F8EJW8_9BACT|nr:MAG: hypothetical protein A2650_00530 [Candidatus Yanofskybacteria bacterium RIFCSPHIGHO2_01_FULL_41_53]OGN10788.1 MAG: hypothetical protein A3B91_02770 [Candidatus Yanofskybacteria bacterium RIFCSPHIGHO2_02_FULL_41_29]OGN17079.1 MAG: hypothetical protein A3F48_03980 [Candidatus Yanofskybacteria bacterium RIFCSPHIGHO2_12_FULL_41_9]OGN21809.1 MAG: hypothetical protein A2916_01335 [Candidatus Yanofskybacteria bacterium RIFCSPLOWO2_01_FULL_41_67]OGN29423.1 MAG: hypothetical protein A3H54_04170 